MARIVEAIGRYRTGQLSCLEAAELLGMSERHFRRLRDAYEAKGAEGIIDRRRGRASGRRAPVDEIESVLEEFRTRYFDFTAKHFHEAVANARVANGKPFKRSYSWTKSVLQLRGLTTKAKRRGAHRGKSASGVLCRGCFYFRTPRPTLGSPRGRRSISSRPWTTRRAGYCRSSSSRRKGRRRALAGSRRRFKRMGCSRPSTPIAAAIIFTRPRRARRWTGAGSRKWGGRWRSSGSSTFPPIARKGAGAWSGCGPRCKAACRRCCARPASAPTSTRPIAGSIASTWHNARFAVAPAEDGTAFIPFAGPLDDILCVQEECVVGNDNTVRYEGSLLQIPESKQRRHFAKAKLRVHEYADGALALFHGPRKIAAYDADGALIEEPAAKSPNAQKSAA